MPNDEAPSHHAIDAPQAATGARGAAQRSFARDERGNPCVIDVWDAPARVFVHEAIQKRFLDRLTERQRTTLADAVAILEELAAPTSLEEVAR